MIFYSFLLVFSVSVIFAVLNQNKREYQPLNFAKFMEGFAGELVSLWHVHLREKFFLFLEKRLRAVRILALKLEQMLFRAAQKIRGIKEKNGNGANNHTNTPA